MGGTPLANPGDVLGAAEVGLVLRMGEPTTLAGALAGLTAVRLETILLMPLVPSLRQKLLIATEALTSKGDPGHDLGRKPQTREP